MRTVLAYGLARADHGWMTSRNWGCVAAVAGILSTLGCGSDDSGASSPISSSKDAGSDSAVVDASGGSGGADAGFDVVTIDMGGGGACGGACPKGQFCVNGSCEPPIDFETLPGGAPADGLSINAQFEATWGVTFGLDKDGDGKPDPGVSPVLAQVGDPTTAFNRDTGAGDTPVAGNNNGSYFLTDDGVVADPPAPLIITYASPVAAAYGEILDIDGAEGWTVDTRDASDKVIDSVVMNAGDPGTGDGAITSFSFSHATADIYSIRLRYTGTDTTVGLAFDNFSPTASTPTPPR